VRIYYVIYLLLRRTRWDKIYILHKKGKKKKKWFIFFITLLLFFPLLFSISHIFYLFSSILSRLLSFFHLLLILL